jgi:hypothetical protein
VIGLALLAGAMVPASPAAAASSCSRVSAAYISGGTNMAPVAGLARCPSGFGASASYPHDPGYHSGIFTSPIDYASITSFDTPIVRIF